LQNPKGCSSHGAPLKLPPMPTTTYIKTFKSLQLLRNNFTFFLIFCFSIYAGGKYPFHPFASVSKAPSSTLPFLQLYIPNYSSFTLGVPGHLTFAQNCPHTIPCRILPRGLRCLNSRTVRFPTPNGSHQQNLPTQILQNVVLLA